MVKKTKSLNETGRFWRYLCQRWVNDTLGRYFMVTSICIFSRSRKIDSIEKYFSSWLKLLSIYLNLIHWMFEQILFNNMIAVISLERWQISTRICPFLANVVNSFKGFNPRFPTRSLELIVSISCILLHRTIICKLMFLCHADYSGYLHLNIYVQYFHTSRNDFSIFSDS